MSPPRRLRWPRRRRASPRSWIRRCTSTDDGDLSEKIGELEDRAKRLSREEREELKRGRELNIITDPAPGK